MEPDGRARHVNTRVHRLPAADGALLRGPSTCSTCRCGWRSGCGWDHPLCRRRGHPLSLRVSMGLRGPGPVVAATAYMLSPYFLQYAARISVILLPWAGLPFMLAFTIVALRRGGWREPALFAIVVALVSGINASSIIYVAVAPILWLLYAVVVLRESTWRHALGDGVAYCGSDPGSVPLVDGGARGGGRLRRQCPQVHGDRLVDVADLQPVRDPAGPGLLVLRRLRTTDTLGDFVLLFLLLFVAVAI